MSIPIQKTVQNYLHDTTALCDLVETGVRVGWFGRLDQHGAVEVNDPLGRRGQPLTAVAMSLTFWTSRTEPGISRKP